MGAMGTAGGDEERLNSVAPMPRWLSLEASEDKEPVREECRLILSPTLKLGWVDG